MIATPTVMLAAALLGRTIAFQPLRPQPSRIFPVGSKHATALMAQDDEWTGDVVSNTQDGRIRGCTIQTVGDSIVDWIIQIDG